ncbi:hypothetical protein, partial [Solidesulfovibrio fructosivorans]|uniref:hypothetical protein n=1 Tax=Solidesulfovibrio fructosivorans TaxID=878 RepID=UPI001F394583
MNNAVKEKIRPHAILVRQNGNAPQSPTARSDTKGVREGEPFKKGCPLSRSPLPKFSNYSSYITGIPAAEYPECP